jgi:hypothetical protein
MINQDVHALCAHAQRIKVVNYLCAEILRMQIQRMRGIGVSERSKLMHSLY